MVVLSLVMMTRLAVPSRSRVTFSSLRPTSSLMTWPPVRTAMSCSIALRRSPKPGALTAAALNVPRILFTTSVARASPSMSSAMMTSGLPVFITASSVGSMAWTVEILALVEQHVGVLEDDFLALGVGHEVRRQVALVELHALGELELGAERVRLLDRDHAVLADLVDGVGDDLADRRVGGRDGGDAGDVGLVVDVLGLRLDRLDGGGDGLLDALLDGHRVGAGGDVVHADGAPSPGRAPWRSWCRHRRCRRSWWRLP